MLNLDENKLAAVVDAALSAVKGDRRWTNAILRAEAELTSGNPYQHFDGSCFLVLSPSGELYEANGACQCRAFAKSQPCWHRAAARLLRRYAETVEPHGAPICAADLLTLQSLPKASLCAR